MARITATATDVDTGDKLQGVQITVECGTKSRSSVTDGDGSASELGLFLNDSQVKEREFALKAQESW